MAIKYIIDGDVVGGSTDTATSIHCKDAEGNESNVQAELDKQNKNIADLGESVSNGKTLVANAITAQGVSTSTSATFADMASNISKISGGFIGTLKATSSGLTSNTWYSTATVDIKSVYPDYQKITIDNICVQIPLFTTINGATLSLSYTYAPSTGIITIKSTGGGNNALWLPSSTSSFNVKVAIV